VRRAGAIFLGVDMILHAILIAFACWDDPTKHRIVFLAWAFCTLGILLLIRGWKSNYLPAKKRGMIASSGEQDMPISAEPVGLMRKPYKAITNILGFAIVVVFFYGIVRFPDFPLEPCGANKYCGHHGHFYTVSEYHAYLTWHQVLWWGSSLAILAVYLLYRLAKKGDEKSGRR
jgi:hypothetical protein